MMKKLHCGILKVWIQSSKIDLIITPFRVQNKMYFCLDSRTLLVFIFAMFTNILMNSSVLEGHSDSVTSACFTPDNRIIATVSNNGDFRLWIVDGTCLYVQDDAHDLGVQCCDFSQNLEPIPNMSNVDNYNFLLATCGNDGLAKLWRISVPKVRFV